MAGAAPRALCPRFDSCCCHFFQIIVTQAEISICTVAILPQGTIQGWRGSASLMSRVRFLLRSFLSNHRGTGGDFNLYRSQVCSTDRLAIRPTLSCSVSAHHPVLSMALDFVRVMHGIGCYRLRDDPLQKFEEVTLMCPFHGNL